MTVRTTRKTLTFTRPFRLTAIDEVQPSGTYTVDTEEEVIDGLSFLASRRVATLIHLPSTSSRVGVTQLVTINPSELEAALRNDIQQSGFTQKNDGRGALPRMELRAPDKRPSAAMANSTAHPHVSNGSTIYGLREPTMTKTYVFPDFLVKSVYLSLAAAAFLFVSMLLMTGLHP